MPCDVYQSTPIIITVQGFGIQFSRGILPRAEVFAGHPSRS